MARRCFISCALYADLAAAKSEFQRPASPFPSDADLAAGAAYLVAAHATLEFHLEELCRTAVYRTVYQYKHDRRTSRTVNSLIAFQYWRQVNYLPQGRLTAASGAEMVCNAANSYIKNVVDKNHGIKSSNVLALLLPLGIEISDLDQLVLDELDSFGLHRGDFAHGRPLTRRVRNPVQVDQFSTAPWTSAAMRPRTALAPWDVEAILERIIPEVRRWDVLVTSRSAER